MQPLGSPLASGPGPVKRPSHRSRRFGTDAIFPPFPRGNRERVGHTSTRTEHPAFRTSAGRFTLERRGAVRMSLARRREASSARPTCVEVSSGADRELPFRTERVGLTELAPGVWVLALPTNVRFTGHASCTTPYPVLPTLSSPRCPSPKSALTSHRYGSTSRCCGVHTAVAVAVTAARISQHRNAAIIRQTPRPMARHCTRPRFSTVNGGRDFLSCLLETLVTTRRSANTRSNAGRSRW